MPEPTRIGFVTNIYSPYKEAMLREIAKLVDLKVYYCATREKDREWQVNFSGDYEYEVMPGKTFNIADYKLHVNPGIIKRFRKDNPDLVIVGEWSYPTVIAAPFILRAMGIPRILWSGSTHKEKMRRRKLTYLFKRLIVSQYHGYVNYTRHAESYVHSLGAPKEHTTIAPVTIDTDFFLVTSKGLREDPGRSVLRNKLQLASDDIGVAFVGQLIERKGVDLLIKALARLGNSKVKALLAGSGPERESLQQLAQQQGVADQVRFLGHCTQRELVELYVACDLFTLPSRKEPSGNVINEAMTIGLPGVISSNIGCDCLTDGVNGHVFKSDEVEDYVRCLKWLIEDPAHRQAAGEAAQQNLLYDYSIQMEARQFGRAVEGTLKRLGKPFHPRLPLDTYLEKHRTAPDQSVFR